MSGWQPIETAPIGVEFQAWVKKFPMDRSVVDYPEEGWWEPMAYMGEDGVFRTYDLDNGWEPPFHVVPTHWQPLPEPPASANMPT